MIKAAFHDAKAKAQLLAMSKATRERVFQRALRRAAAPTVALLRNAWAGARRRKGVVTGDISRAQQAQVRVWKKGARTGTARVLIGTNYKRGGHANVWHLLENGFRHFGNNRVYQNAPEILAAKKSFGEFVKQNRKLTGKSPEARREFTRLSVEWARRNPDLAKSESAAWRRQNAHRSAARGGASRRIAGRHISRPIASRETEAFAARARDMVLEEIERARR